MLDNRRQRWETVGVIAKEILMLANGFHQLKIYGNGRVVMLRSPNVGLSIFFNYKSRKYVYLTALSGYCVNKKYKPGTLNVQQLLQ